MLNPKHNAGYMARAISLGQRGKGLTDGNPNVGCLIVKNDIVIGRGWTQHGGRPHAEAIALKIAGKAAKSADIYTTLEPCAHDSHRGPACVDLLIDAKPARVIVASLDADERTHRRGVDKLGKAGIAVSVGLLESEARASMGGSFRVWKKVVRMSH